MSTGLTLPPVPIGMPGFARLNRDLWCYGGNTIRSFNISAPDAYRPDLPNVIFQILEARHFALDTAADEIALHIREFIR